MKTTPPKTLTLGERVKQLISRPTIDWAERVPQLEAELSTAQTSIENLRTERASIALLTAEGDSDAIQETTRLRAEIEAAERRRQDLHDALQSARGCLQQQRQRESEAAESQRRAQAERLSDELLAIDQKADIALATLATLLDQRAEKIRELTPLVGSQTTKVLIVHAHVAAALKSALRGHVQIDGPSRRDAGSLADLDGRFLSTRSESVSTEAA